MTTAGIYLVPLAGYSSLLEVRLETLAKIVQGYRVHADMCTYKRCMD
jgi:hypothetical protein